MRRRLVLVLVIAAVVGLVASTLVYRVLKDVAGGAKPQDMEMIVVATVNMNMAETVTPSHVKLLPWPAKSVPSGAIRKMEDAEGRVVRASIVGAVSISVISSSLGHRSGSQSSKDAYHSGLSSCSLSSAEWHWRTDSAPGTEASAPFWLVVFPVIMFSCGSC